MTKSKSSKSSNKNKHFIFGKWQESKFDAELAQQICDQARSIPYAEKKLLLPEIYKIFEVVRKKWADHSYIRRQRMQEVLPKHTGFSPKMIELGLNELYNLFDPAHLQKKVDIEFRGIPRSVGYKYNHKNQTALKWQPIGSVLHILSGNVFLVGPGSLIEGVLTGNITLLKMPSAETNFMPEFIDSLVEAEQELGMEGVITGTLAAIQFSSSQVDVIETFKMSVDGIVIWGGEQAVRAYRNNLPARTRAIVFGPKLSIALALESGMAAKGVEECAKNLAFELAIWDQNACTAPQVCFVQGKERAKELVDALAIQLELQQKAIPAGTLDQNQAAEIRKLRTIYEIAEHRGDFALRESKSDLDWTVMLDTDVQIEPSPLHRTIKIVAVEDVAEVLARVEELRAYVQTVGLWADESEFLDYGNQLGKIGVLRIVDIGEMSGGEIDDPHDGAYDLPQMMNLVVHRLRQPSNKRVYERLPKDERSLLLQTRLEQTIAVAKSKTLYKDYPFDQVRCVEDLHKLPILTKEKFQAGLDPSLVSDHVLAGGYVTRSGGSTGEPKFSYFNQDDWKLMSSHASEVFRSCGINENDRVANCLSMGDLYGSFISFDEIFRGIGSTNFSFGTTTPPENFAMLAKRFGVNAVCGIPTYIMDLLRKAHVIDPSLKIQKVIYAGVPLNPNDRKWLKEVLGVERICSVIGTTEANHIAYQDQDCIGNQHRMVEDYNYLEIVDEKGKPVAENDVGAILVTSLQKFGYPLIRYHIGDQARLLISDNGQRYIEYLGRNDDVMAIAYMNIKFSDFEKIFHQHGASALQIVASFEGEKERIDFHIEHPQPDSVDTKSIGKDLIQHIVDFKEIDQKKLFNWQIHVHAVGELKRNSRTGKLASYIDHRIKETKG